MSIMRWLKKVLRRPSPDEEPSPSDGESSPDEDPVAAAERALREALLADPESIPAQVASRDFGLRLASLQEEDPRAAVRVLRRLDAARPGVTAIFERLAALYETLRDVPAARALWLRLLERDPSRAAEAHERLGALAEREGDRDAAIEHFETAVGLDARRPTGRDALRRLYDVSVMGDTPPPPLVIIAHEPPRGYTLEHPLGRGGYGTVYLAQDLALQRPVAIKFLHAHLARRVERRAAFFEEARLVASLNAPGVVKLYEASESRQLIIMEFMTHGALSDRLAAGRPLQPLAALRCARALCRTLASVHARGIVHRDIKPGNVLFRETDQPVLGDFGIAGFELDADAARGAGTRRYAAPEVLKGASADRRADIYGVGLLLAEMLCAASPPEALSARSAWVTHALMRLPAPLRAVADETISPLLAADPEARPGDAARVVDALDALIELCEEDLLDERLVEAASLARASTHG